MILGRSCLKLVNSIIKINSISNEKQKQAYEQIFRKQKETKKPETNFQNYLDIVRKSIN